MIVPSNKNDAFQEKFEDSLIKIFQMDASQNPLYRCMGATNFDKRCFYYYIDGYAEFRPSTGYMHVDVKFQLGYCDYAELTTFNYIPRMFYKFTNNSDEIELEYKDGYNVIMSYDGKVGYSLQTMENRFFVLSYGNFRWHSNIPFDVPKHTIDRNDITITFTDSKE